jgi:hypothetical protein
MDASIKGMEEKKAGGGASANGHFLDAEPSHLLGCARSLSHMFKRDL